MQQLRNSLLGRLRYVCARYMNGKGGIEWMHAKPDLGFFIRDQYFHLLSLNLDLTTLNY